MKKGQTLKGELDKQNPPKQYAQGWTEFYKLKFKVTPDVLIPRPESELLVDEVLSIINHQLTINNLKTDQVVVFDVGTGSGCIAVSVAKNAPDEVKVFGLDVSDKALKVAEQNARLNRVLNQVILFQSNLLDFIKPNSSSIFNSKFLPEKKGYIILVANLPYIPTARLMYIDPMVVDFEPKVALDGGYDGFELYRKLFAQIREKDINLNVLICEIDEEQGQIALQEAKRYFPEAKAEVKKDFYKADRILTVKF